MRADGLTFSLDSGGLVSRSLADVGVEAAAASAFASVDFDPGSGVDGVDGVGKDDFDVPVGVAGAGGATVLSGGLRFCANWCLAVEEMRGALLRRPPGPDKPAIRPAPPPPPPPPAPLDPTAPSAMNDSRLDDGAAAAPAPAPDPAPAPSPPPPPPTCTSWWFNG